MFRTLALLVPLVLVLETSCCATNPSPHSDRAHLDVNIWYAADADPAKDARQAAAAGDDRFLVVSGIASIIPYVNDNHPELSDLVKTKPLRGSSDHYNSYWERRANAIARLYAQVYNDVLYFELERSDRLPKAATTQPL